jgi:hypothetical protein
MYVRQISRKNKNGTVTRYLQLSRKVRDPETGEPKDKILYHFGREDQIDKEQIKRLIKSLSRFLDPKDRAESQALINDFGFDLKVKKNLSYGASFLLNGLWEKLEIDKTIKKLIKKRNFQIDIERLLFALVANRALAPDSKLYLERWVGEQVFIEGLDKVSVHMLYRAIDFLIEHNDEVQKDVYFSVATLLNLEVDLLFFDTTSTYFEIENEDLLEEVENDEIKSKKGFRCWGHSKDHRPDAPQIVIGLAVTRTGIPVRCWTFPGNTSDSKLIKEVQSDMADWKLNRIVWVVDRGMAGEPQRVALQRGGNHVIMGEKLRRGSKAAQEALKRPGRYQKIRDNLEIKEVKIKNGSETRRFVIVYNQKEAKRDKCKREELLSDLEIKLEILKFKRDKAPKTYATQVSKLKLNRRYGKYVKEDKSGSLTIDNKVKRSEERLDGKYMLSCTDPSLSAEDIALGYKQLKEVEYDFHLLKHTIDIRPVYHRIEDRIRGHVLLCWLALLMIRLVENETNQTWDKIRDELSKISLTCLENKDGQIVLCTDLNSNQYSIFKSLKVSPPKSVQSTLLHS